ncbi:glycosidase [bacterium]|nr:glycosidase [bacterium]
MIQLKRMTKRPVLSPNDLWKGERGGVFNAAAIKKDDLVYLIYRAVDYPGNSDFKFTSSLGCALSEDGISFNKLEKPIFLGNNSQEKRGIEDPRIVKLEDTYYMMYTGFSGKSAKICMAKSKNLIHWERMGIVLDEDNKDASLFPEKINNKYYMFHRRHPNIWIANSDDLKTWENHKIIMEPLPSSKWECQKVGIAGPPFKTNAGWLLIYHGVNNEKVYSLGIALLDLKDPQKLIWRQREPILTPELGWEKNGAVKNVVFSCGGIEYDDCYYIYYGGADTAIGVARLDKADLDHLKS